MDKKIDRPQISDRYCHNSGMTIEEVIRNLKESSEKLEILALKIRKKISH